jgi:ribosomal protein S18 acetylase RimI-like enzyme
MTSEVTIVQASAERLGEVEPLWRALREHHVKVAADVAPIRTEPESWTRRRAEYERWLGDGSATLFLALGEHPVGYLMLRLGAGPPTWQLGEPLATVETLSILPEARGSGVGKALMDAARAKANACGASTLCVELVHTNEAARRFYEREGFEPFYLSMLAQVLR